MFDRLAFLSQKIEEIIVSSKEKYYTNLSSKLNNPHSHCKLYWSLLKTLVNGRGVSLIPPTQIDHKFVTNFTEKAKVFKNHFAKQCRVIDNNSQIPDRPEFGTNKRLNNIKFANANILKILKNLDLNKAYGHGNLSIRIIRLRGDTICKPLELTFRDCLKEGRWPSL